MAFLENYSEFYNIFYRDKDYKREADYIDKLIKKYLLKDRIQLLDLACGTGNHVFELIKLGYIAEGSDISKSMIQIAVEEAKKRNILSKFYNYSFQDANKIGKKFDVIISMFSAINYLTEYKDLKRTLKNIHNLLVDDGIFIFDYWNGNAVVRDYSPVRYLQKKDKSEEIIRISNTELNLEEQIANVEFTCMYFKDNLKQLEFKELHKMRYFYFKEIEIFLKLNGFEIIHKSTFLDLDKINSPFDWNISIVAKKTSQ